jgi:kynurenine formamidase
MHVPSHVCTVCYDFGGLTISDFPVDASFLTCSVLHVVPMLESDHAVDAAQSMMALR